MIPNIFMDLNKHYPVISVNIFLFNMKLYILIIIIYATKILYLWPKKGGAMYYWSLEIMINKMLNTKQLFMFVLFFS